MRPARVAVLPAVVWLTVEVGELSTVDEVGISGVDICVIGCVSVGDSGASWTGEAGVSMSSIGGVELSFLSPSISTGERRNRGMVTGALRRIPFFLPSSSTN